MIVVVGRWASNVWLKVSIFHKHINQFIGKYSSVNKIKISHGKLQHHGGISAYFGPCEVGATSRSIYVCHYFGLSKVRATSRATILVLIFISFFFTPLLKAHKGLS
jgi:hypothetical protein